MTREEILGRIRQAVAAVAGDRLRGVVLYGSSARGDGSKESDIDVLVLLDGPVALWRDHQLLMRAVYPLVLDLGRSIHLMPVDASRYETVRFPLYENARREGIRG